MFFLNAQDQYNIYDRYNKFLPKNYENTTKERHLNILNNKSKFNKLVWIISLFCIYINTYCCMPEYWISLSNSLPYLIMLTNYTITTIN